MPVVSPWDQFFVFVIACGHLAPLGHLARTIRSCALSAHGVPGLPQTFHLGCLSPPLHTPPRGYWCCSACLAVESARPGDPYGFRDAARRYSLVSFERLAYTFRARYFGGRDPSPEEVEREFWRIVAAASSEADVQVRVVREYDKRANEIRGRRWVVMMHLSSCVWPSTAMY